MTRTRAGIKNALSLARRPLDMLDNRRGDGVKMTSIEECGAVM